MLLELAMVLAMQDATTRCHTFGGETTCQTEQNRSGYDAYRAARDARLNSAPQPSSRAPDCAAGDWWFHGCSRGAHNEALRLQEERLRSSQARDRVMALLRQGDCQGAVTAALDTGDLQFATDVRTFCAATPTPAQ